MPLNREQLKPMDQKYFQQFTRWQAPAVRPNVVRDLLLPAEIAEKRARYPEVMAKALELALKPLDVSLDWDQLHGKVFSKLGNASLYYLFTGDPQVIPAAIEAFEVIEACRREYFTFSTCLGVLDMDLRTAHVAHAVAAMECCFGDALPAELRRRMSALVVKRILTPGLEAERTKRYPWMHSDANWRIILCGGFAFAGMVFADDFPEYRALLEYGIEAMLVCAATGDRAGSWNEGPGYWNYGFSLGTAFMHALKTFTGGKVNLFTHPFYRRTGDFFVFMHPRAGVIWNWSDCGKQAGASVALTAFARALQHPTYQQAVETAGIDTIENLYWYDPALKSAPPTADACTRYFPSVGVLTWRTGFDERDTFVGVKGGSLVHYNHHCHVDMGTVVVHTEGRELLAELDHWPYPHEGIKDPNRKGYQPGFYDIDNQRWYTQDFDQRLAVGHNAITLEGSYPEFKLGVSARFLRRIDEADFKATVVDSTPYYTPLATRVRRYIVFLPPDRLLIVDDIRAKQPVRARLHFHYPLAQPSQPLMNPGPEPAKEPIEAEITWGLDDFTITNGPAVLLARMLYPTATDHLIIGHDSRRVTYFPPAGLLTQYNKYLYVENLYRKPRLVFVTALQFGATGFTPAHFTLDGPPLPTDQFSILTRRDGQSETRVRFDLARNTVCLAR